LTANQEKFHQIITPFVMDPREMHVYLAIGLSREVMMEKPGLICGLMLMILLIREIMTGMPGQ